MNEKTPRETAARIRVLTRAAVGYALSEKPRTLPNVPTSVEIALSHLDDLANELERESTIADKPVDPTHSRRPSYAQHRRANKPIGVSPEDVQKWLDHINSSESSFDGHTNYRVIESLAIERDQWEVMSQQAAGLAAELRTALFAMDAELTQVKIDRDRFESLRTNAERHCGVLTARAEKAEGERDRLARELAETKSHLYVPGRWRCPKCNFGLMQMRLRASDGAVGVRDDPGEKCPNCDTPLWRVTEREAGNELADRCAEQIQRAVAAEELLAAANAEIARLKSGGCARGQPDGATQFCAEAAQAMAEVTRLREALTPSAETKAAYIGEIAFHLRDGDEVLVPWTSMKEFMAMIRARAALAKDPLPVNLRATILAWKTAFDGIEAHIKDRVAMDDPASPETYLAIIRADVDRVLRDTKQIEASWWHDRKLANDWVREAAEAMRERAAEVADKSRDAEPETNPTMPRMVREQLLVARATARDIAAAIRAIPIDAATAKEPSAQ